MLFVDHHEDVELIPPDFIEGNADPQLQCRPKFERPSQQQPGLGRLRRIQLVQRAVVATSTVIGSVRAQAGVAQFLAAQCPVNQEPQGGLLRPLPGCQFGSAVSWNATSRASIAAFTATAW